MKTRFFKLLRKLICRWYKIDLWHISPPCERAYVKDVVNHLNNRKGDKITAADIGCGLCDISSRLNFSIVECYDADPKVLEAAMAYRRFWCKPKEMVYGILRFPQMPYMQKYYDAIVLVNYIHHIPPDQLNDAVKKLFTMLSPSGEIILDTVYNPCYEYNHNIEKIIAGIDCHVSCLGTYPAGRKVWAIKSSCIVDWKS